MAWYQMAGQDFYFPEPIPELEAFDHPGAEPVPVSWTAPVPQALSSRAQGWVGGEQRNLEIWSAHAGVLLKVNGASDVYISPDGGCISRRSDYQSDPREATELDREVLAGPALVLALAMRGTWCLHASAASFNDQVTGFVGESGQGKSTLAAYLSNADWRLMADDILPARQDQAGAQVWPHFPQLKLKVQPAAALAQHLPLNRICVLAQADVPELRQLSQGEALQALIGHTAGARLFDPSLLAKHLAFCAWAAARIPVYRLAYPRNWEALDEVRELLENSC